MIQTATIPSSNGVAAGVRYAGTAGPALVFVHGVGSTAAIWDGQLEAFSKTHRCFAIELRGNGVPKPEPDPALITRGGYGDDVLAVMAWAKVERFTLVGCSLGGVVAFELWGREPKRFDAMVIVGSFAKYPDAQAYAEGVKAAVNAMGDMLAFGRARAPKLGLPPDRERETIEQMAVKAVPSYLAATQATWTGDYTAVLSTIDVPVLVTCGERDFIAPLARSQEIAAAIPGAQLETVPDAGHVANADNPVVFDAMLERFLATAQRT
jgi:3-oxoadipate enol-lactonase